MTAITLARDWRIAMPIVLSNATVPLLGVVDTAVIGQLGEDRAARDRNVDVLVDLNRAEEFENALQFNFKGGGSRLPRGLYRRIADRSNAARHGPGGGSLRRGFAGVDARDGR